MLSRLVRTRPWLAALAGVVALVVLAVGLGWFQPWKLVVDEVVVEEPPVATGVPLTTPTVAPSSPTVPSAGPSTPTVSSTPPRGPRVVAEGKLISHEHPTTGSVQLLVLPDGSQVLRLVDLATSNGPDLRVWLADAPVLPGRDGWFVFDDGMHADLGALKGNRGTQNYPVPPGVDPRQLRSVSIWCDRFDVSFGAAELRWS